ncbi:MAG: DUF4279 domain-containing protein [Halanaerobiales bacterium]|nr:DUF4279 domain-containing protein [Halanaerobiales bacterium]
MSTNANVEIVIVGEDFKLDIITNELDILPTEHWVKGEQVPNRNTVRKDTCWSYGLGSEETLNINIQLLKLVEILCPKKDILIRLKKMLQLEYLILVTINIENDVKPIIGIKSTVIELMNDIGAELDIDLYLF